MSDKMFNFIKKGYLHDLIWKYGTKKTVTQNGTDIDVAGLDKIDVNVPNPSTGKVNITSTAEVDVTQYAAAQVVDANLVAENIKKDVPILGVTGSYEGGGDSDFSTAVVTFVPNVLGEWIASFIIPAILPGGEYFVNDMSYADLTVNNFDYTPITIILYKGCARGTIYSDDADISVSGNAVPDGNDIIITGDCTITFSTKNE